MWMLNCVNFWTFFMKLNITTVPLCSRSPALIGCFVVDRKYFEEIGLLDEGMEIYGGENVELGIRVSLFIKCRLFSRAVKTQNWTVNSGSALGRAVSVPVPSEVFLPTAKIDKWPFLWQNESCISHPHYSFGLTHTNWAPAETETVTNKITSQLHGIYRNYIIYSLEMVFINRDYSKLLFSLMALQNCQDRGVQRGN